MRYLFTSIVLALAASLLVFGIGCASNSSTSEDEKLEHASAPHRPKDYPDAVAQIERRNPFKAVDSRDANSQPPLSELNDILVWLPEIAADTDLKKSEWDEVRSLAAELEALVAKPKSESAAAERYAVIVSRLQKLTEGSDAWKTGSAVKPDSSPEDVPMPPMPPR